MPPLDDHNHDIDIVATEMFFGSQTRFLIHNVMWPYNMNIRRKFEVSKFSSNNHYIWLIAQLDKTRLQK